MFLTLLFTVLFFSKKEKSNIKQNDTYDEIELFEVDNILNQSNNPVYYENYWDKVYKEILHGFILLVGIVLSIYFDISYIYYVYFQPLI